MKFVFDICGDSNIGLKRENNEDNYIVNNYTYSKNIAYNALKYKGNLVAFVFDGMGGGAWGEIASSIAANTLSKYYDEIIAKNRIIKTGFKSLNKLLEYISAANLNICEEATKLKATTMGSTLSGIYIKGKYFSAINIGDSRVYLYRQSELVQITTDHNEAQRMIRLGIIKPEESKKTKYKYQLTQYLGVPESFITPEITESKKLLTGDTILVCTDGLTDMVDDLEISSILGASKNSKQASSDLLARAIKNGGQDNITLIVIKVCKNKLLGRGIRYE